MTEDYYHDHPNQVITELIQMKSHIQAILLLFATVLLGSCATVTQTDIEGGVADIGITAKNGCLAVNLKTPFLDQDKKGLISESESYATDHSGKRYRIIVIPNEYARNYPEKSFWTSDYIWLKGSRGEKIKWNDGSWKIVLDLKSSTADHIYKAAFELDTNSVSLMGYSGHEF